MYSKAKISKRVVHKTLECFRLDIDATRTAKLVKVNRKTVN